MKGQQFVLSEKLVAAIHESLGGFHAGYRAVHARGRIYRATFTATPEAREISRAAHLQGATIPATVRFSFGSGDPNAPPAKVLGMATKFFLPNGLTTDLVCLNLPQFPARSPEEVIALLQALRPTQNGAPDQAKVGAFLQSRPAAALVFKTVMAMPIPTSLTQTRFSAFHAFCFVNVENERRYARYHWEPANAADGVTEDAVISDDPDALFARLEERLRSAAVGFDLVLQFATPGDPLDDPSAPWPSERERVTIGRLEVIARTSNDELGDPIMVHDPTRVTDGIECPDDPILHARRGAYEVSVAERMRTAAT